MNQALTPHFSRKVLFLSFIFLMANLGIFALKNLATTGAKLETLAPKLVSATAADVEVKSPYDPEFRAAENGQEILSGTTIKTTEAEFAQLVLGNNVVQIDESTTLELVENNFQGAGAYLPENPRLVFRLHEGSAWVNAYDLIEVKTKRAATSLHHAIGLLTYSEPLNRVMVVTGDANLALLSDTGDMLSQFVVPLHNQVTFVDTQITDVYTALKPSKLKKELKMTPLSEEVLVDPWVAKNANEVVESQQDFTDGLIQSGVAYAIKSGFQKAANLLTFVPEAERNLALSRAETMLSYLLGGIATNNDSLTAKEILADFETLVAERKNDPLMQELIVSTLFATENAAFGSPTFLVKESMLNLVEQNEGAYVYRVYLTDLRRALFAEDNKVAESLVNKWKARWTPGKVAKNLTEFDRQVQIYNHTLLSYIDTVPIAMLDTYDELTTQLMAASVDPEETKFDVTQNRLQIAASLVSSYRYALAKQYLKNSYLSLNIEEENPDLASTKIFLESGRLLAQRIEYAEDVLHGAARPIDETQFRDYFQARTRDEALSDDLRKFFELDQEEAIVTVAAEAPTVEEVSERFLLSRINVNYSDISLVPGAGFTYNISSARLLDRGASNESLSFDATYDFKTNSVTDVMAEGRAYAGSFTLSDLVLVLQRGDALTQDVYAPSTDATGLDLLITDDEKIVALEGQLVAQDVARQLAFNELEAVGVVVPEVKDNIEILDAFNLDKFGISNALVPRGGGLESITINFDYNSQTEMASQVISTEGRLLLEEVAVSQLAQMAIDKVLELEAELAVIADFNVFAKQNDLYIDVEDIIYLDGLLQVTDLELLTLGLKVSGLLDPETAVFATVSHELLSANDIDIKEYFESLADLYLVDYFQEQGLEVTADEITTKFPFNRVELRGIEVQIEALNTLAGLIQEAEAQAAAEQAAAEAEAQAEEEAVEEEGEEELDEEEI